MIYIFETHTYPYYKAIFMVWNFLEIELLHYQIILIVSPFLEDIPHILLINSIVSSEMRSSEIRWGASIRGIIEGNNIGA